MFRCVVGSFALLFIYFIWVGCKWVVEKESHWKRENVYIHIFYTLRLHINIYIIDFLFGFLFLPMENTTKINTKWEKQKEKIRAHIK